MSFKYILFFLFGLNYSCKLFNKEQLAKTNATISRGASKKGVFPLIVEQIGITDKSLKTLAMDYKGKDFEGDMVLETVIWMEAFGNDVNVQFENPEKNFSRIEVDKITSDTKVCLYKSQVIRHMLDAVVEQEFNLSKVDEILKSPMGDFQLDKPGSDATPEEIELYHQNKKVWLKVKQQRNSMVQSYKKTMEQIKHEPQKKYAPLAYYGKMRAIDHFHKSAVPISNLFSDRALAVDKNNQSKYNVRAVPLNTITNYLPKLYENQLKDDLNAAKVKGTVGKGKANLGAYAVGLGAAAAGAALLGSGGLLLPILGIGIKAAGHLTGQVMKDNISASLNMESTEYINRAILYQSINKKFCDLKNKSPQLVTIDQSKSMAVLGGAYSPAGFYSMGFLKDYPKDIISSDDLKNTQKHISHYYQTILKHNKGDIPKDSNSLINILQKSTLQSDSGYTIVGGDFRINPEDLPKIIDGDVYKPTSVSVLSQVVKDINLKQIKNFESNGNWETNLCNPINIEFMCL